MYFSPIALFKLNSEINIESQRSDKRSSDSNIVIKSHHKGLYFNTKEKKLLHTVDITSTRSFILNLGLYLEINKSITIEKKVDGVNTVANITANAHIWGLGNSNVKKNSFNKNLQKAITDHFYKD